MKKLPILLMSSAALAVIACAPDENTAQSGSMKNDAEAQNVQAIESDLVSDLADQADLVIIGTIYTGSTLVDMDIVDYITIKNGVIASMGKIKKSDIMGDKINFESAKRVVILENGQAAFPGFTDSHGHLMGIGQREMTLNLESTASIAELVKEMAGEVSTTPKGQVVYGRGWIETGWPDQNADGTPRFPTAADLDVYSPDHPVILGRADGHAVVVNSMALEMAGITDETPDPDGGKILRDENGKATGMLIDNAELLVMGLMREPDDATRQKYIQKGAEVYAKYGWTGIHNMSVPLKNVHLQRDLDEAGKLPIRVYNNVEPQDLQALIDDPDLTDDTFGHFSNKVTARGVKFYADGALGSRGALLHMPYQDDPHNTGLQLMQKDDAMAAYQLAMDNNIQVTTHAIGDLGNTLVLNWYKEMFEKEGLLQEDTFKNYAMGKRWRIEHAQVLRQQDIPMFHDLGVIASMQPSHAIGDLHFAKSRVGKERLRHAYAWKDLNEANVMIVGGTDAPVERGDPMIEYYALTTRKDLKGFADDHWFIDQALPRGAALESFTIWPAWASFNENDLGVLEVGKRADITILSQNIMNIDNADIPKTHAIYTIVDGEVVFER